MRQNVVGIILPTLTAIKRKLQRDHVKFFFSEHYSLSKNALYSRSEVKRDRTRERQRERERERE